MKIMKKKNFQNNIVYSTAPNVVKEEQEDEFIPVVSNEQQLLKVRIESKHRAGKLVTLVEGFIGLAEAREQMVKQLKNFCGTGGSSKDGEILLQGDQRDKIMQWLQKNGFTKAKKI